MSHKPRAGESASPLVTREVLHLTLQEFRTDLHRALWILGAAIVAAAGANAVVAVTVVATVR